MILHHCIDNISLDFSPLIPAAQEGHLEVVKYLISQGYSVQEKDNEGKNNI